MAEVQKIRPFIWFNGQAEEAVTFYTTIFKDGKIKVVKKYEEGMPGEKGKVLTAVFQIEGQEFMAIDGGPHYNLTPAISFMVNCEDQKEVDHLWEKLSEGGKILQCGWLTDKFGITWQIIPKYLSKVMSQSDPVKARRVFEAMMKMTKIELDKLEEAANG